jgi:hypothetical protein
MEINWQKKYQDVLELLKGMTDVSLLLVKEINSLNEKIHDLESKLEEQ